MEKTENVSPLHKWQSLFEYMEQSNYGGKNDKLYRKPSTELILKQKGRDNCLISKLRLKYTNSTLHQAVIFKNEWKRTIYFKKKKKKVSSKYGIHIKYSNILDFFKAFWETHTNNSDLVNFIYSLFVCFFYISEHYTITYSHFLTCKQIP